MAEKRTLIGIGSRGFNPLGRTEESDRKEAFTFLVMALKCGGNSIDHFEIVEDDATHDRIVEAHFESGCVRTANITGDAIPCAIWDVMRQIPELQEKG